MQPKCNSAMRHEHKALDILADLRTANLLYFPPETEQASKMLSTISIRTRNGVDLYREWLENTLDYILNACSNTLKHDVAILSMFYDDNQTI